VLLGHHSEFAEPFQRTNRSTAGSSGSCPWITAALVGGNTGALAADRRRQQLVIDGSHGYCLAEV